MIAKGCCENMALCDLYSLAAAANNEPDIVGNPTMSDARVGIFLAPTHEE